MFSTAEIKGVNTMSTGFLPKSKTGKSSVILAIISILLNIGLISLIQSGGLEQDTISDWIAGVTSLLGMAVFVTGIISITKSKERSILVYLGMAAIILLFVIGEFLFVH